MVPEFNIAVGRAFLCFGTVWALLALARDDKAARIAAGFFAAWGLALLAAARLHWPQVVDLPFGALLAGAPALAVIGALRRRARPPTGMDLLWLAVGCCPGVGLAIAGAEKALPGESMRPNLPPGVWQGFATLGVVAWAWRTARREHDARIAALQATVEELRLAVRHDPLTGLLNRRAYEGLRDAPLPGFFGAVALIDLDGFKTVNDGHGHPAGDAALQAVARALQARVRASDYVFRWGGDEFLALLVGGSVEDAERRVRDVASALAGVRLSADAPRVPIGLSWGVAAFPGADGLDAAVAAADALMYARRRDRTAAESR